MASRVNQILKQIEELNLELDKERKLGSDNPNAICPTCKILVLQGEIHECADNHTFCMTCSPYAKQCLRCKKWACTTDGHYSQIGLKYHFCRDCGKTHLLDCEEICLLLTNEHNNKERLKRIQQRGQQTRQCLLCEKIRPVYSMFDCAQGHVFCNGCAPGALRCRLCDKWICRLSNHYTLIETAKDHLAMAFCNNCATHKRDECHSLC